MSINLTEEKIQELINKQSNGKLRYIRGLKNIRTDCHWGCNICGYEWDATPSNTLYGKRTECPRCIKVHKVNKKSRRKYNYTEEDLHIIEEEHDGNLKYISSFISWYKNCLWGCAIHVNYQWLATPESMKRSKYGCHLCAYEHIAEDRKMNLDLYEQRLHERYKGKIKFDRSSFVNMRKHATFYCKYHGKIRTTPDNMLRFDCKKCAASHLENEILELLDKKHVKYKYNKALKDCVYKSYKTPLRPDFYITTKDGILWIELDGQQHFIPSYGEEAFRKQKEKDELKNQYCKEHNIILMRVASDASLEYIDNRWNTLDKLKELIDIGIDENGNVDLDVFKPYDFNREI